MFEILAVESKDVKVLDRNMQNNALLKLTRFIDRDIPALTASYLKQRWRNNHLTK